MFTQTTQGVGFPLKFWRKVKKQMMGESNAYCNGKTYTTETWEEHEERKKNEKR